MTVTARHVVFGAGAVGLALTEARGAAVVYQVLIPAYDRWVQEFPTCRPASSPPRSSPTPAWSAWTTSTCTAAGTASPSPRTTPTRRTPGRARSAPRWPDLLAAHDAGRVEVAIGRASDYFGPRGGAQSP